MSWFTALVLPLTFAVAPDVEAAPAKDIVNLIAGTSSPGAITPISVGGRHKNWVYASFCVNSGTFTQSFPVSIQLTDGNNHPGDTAHVTFQKGGTLPQSAITVPGGVTITDDGSILDLGSVSINATGLAAGAYTFSVSAKAPGLNYVNRSLSGTVVVGGGCTGSFIALFSDDQFNPLQDCGGFDVTTETGGTFIIGDASGTAAETRPQHLYYNFIYANTSASASLELDLTSTNLTPVGTDSAHDATFTTASFSADLPTFQGVNSTGTSCGTTGPCMPTVNTGETLWAIWEVDWSGLGGSDAGVSNVCGNIADVSVATALTLKNGALTLATSNGSASGYIGCLEGDVDGNGIIDVGDVFYLINFLFANGPAPVCSGDVDASTTVDIADVFYLINYLFAAGPPPV
jgi:hypothetical protein